MWSLLSSRFADLIIAGAEGLAQEPAMVAEPAIQRGNTWLRAQVDSTGGNETIFSTVPRWRWRTAADAAFQHSKPSVVSNAAVALPQEEAEASRR